MLESSQATNPHISQQRLSEQSTLQNEDQDLNSQNEETSGKKTEVDGTEDLGSHDEELASDETTTQRLLQQNTSNKYKNVKKPQWERANDRLKLVEDLLAKHKYHRRALLLAMSATLLLLLLTIVIYNYQNDYDSRWKHVSLTVMEGVMAFEYGVLLLAFIPLFVAFMQLLKRSFEDVYNGMKVRSSIAFTAFMLVLIFRLTVYCLIQFSTVKWVYAENVKGEIPLYISEILIALCYLKMIVSLHQQQK